MLIPSGVTLASCPLSDVALSSSSTCSCICMDPTHCNLSVLVFPESSSMLMLTGNPGGVGGRVGAATSCACGSTRTPVSRDRQGRAVSLSKGTNAHLLYVLFEPIHR